MRCDDRVNRLPPHLSPRPPTPSRRRRPRLMHLCRPRLKPSHSSSTLHPHRRSSPTPLRVALVAAAHNTTKHDLNVTQAASNGAAGVAAGVNMVSASSAPPSSALIPVDFYFDVLSPYSYFAFETLLRYRSSWGLSLRLKPVFQSALISATANQPPALNAAKAPYLSKDVQRQARYLDLTLARFPPTRFAEVLTGSLAVQRMLTALSLTYPDRPHILERVTRNVWHRHFGRDEDILSTDSKLAALMDGTGLSLSEAQSVIDASTSPAVKAALTANTAEALAHGAFGVPTMVFPVSAAAVGSTGPQSESAWSLPGVDAPGESAMLFGSDRFHLMAHMLQREFNGPRPAAQTAASAAAGGAVVSASTGGSSAIVAKKKKITSRL